LHDRRHVVEDLSIKKGLVIPGGELEMTTSRSGGPGGQHANKTSSRVTIHWNLVDTTVVSESDRARLLVKLATHLNSDGMLQVTGSGSRSQHQNRDEARERLAGLVGGALQRPKPRRNPRPSRGAKRRRLEAKKRRSNVKKSRQKPGKDE
jgi:ribosome-associated protein